jgi:predicted Zn-dependent peptidase
MPRTCWSGWHLRAPQTTRTSALCLKWKRNVMANSSREQMCYTGDTTKTLMPKMVELVVDTVRTLLFNEREVQEQLSKVTAETD